ncbi:MAG: hypothetical protein PUJ31_05035 [Prevotella pectinovora]|nr:hypothetical protein [Prevotella pectinovora]
MAFNYKQQYAVVVMCKDEVCQILYAELEKENTEKFEEVTL